MVESISSLLSSKRFYDCHPVFGDFGKAFYPAVYGSEYEDISREMPNVSILATIRAGKIDYFGFPVQLLLSDECTYDDVVGALQYLESQQAACIRISDYGDENEGDPGLLASACNARGYSAASVIGAYCDLTKGEAYLHSAVRKSYRSLINWGRKNLSVKFVDKETPDRHAFRQYQDFHRQVAGRTTRTQASWDMMFEIIAGGFGELALGFLADGCLVSGTMVIDGKRISYYASGVYDRERFEKPMGHWLLYQSILRSRSRGREWFDLAMPYETQTQKESAIGFFKRGFATHVMSHTVWKRVN